MATIFESKNPDLTLENGQSLEIWKIEGDQVIFLSDCELNYPQYYVGTMPADEMFGSNLGELLSTGWDVVQYSVEAVKWLRKVNPKLAKKKAPVVEETAPDQIKLWQETKKPRPRALIGRTFSVETPLGKAFITINENDAVQPFEIFINTAKAGSDTAAVSEAIGRLISYVLRLASPVEPSQRLTDVTRQLAGIGGGRSLGFGPNRVRSLPDGVAQVLEEYLDDRAIRIGKTTASSPVVQEYLIDDLNKLAPQEPTAASLPTSPLKIGDLCPECGVAAVINEEGCRKCYSCGFSEC